MIPRFKPYLSAREIAAAWRPGADAVRSFEHEFAAKFGGRQAIAFSYGRSALRMLFEALGISGAEVILPAYTCVVVAHATVLSGNHCRFVDATLGDYNMDLDQVEAAMTEHTAAVIATHLFGYPLDLDRLRDIVTAAERRFGRRILIVHDCAHSFGARWRGRLVSDERDVALFGLGISKLITSIFGGMLTTGDEELASKVRAWRDRDGVPPSASRRLTRRLYLAATYPAFDRRLYGLTRWLQEDTPMLDRLTKAYHLDDMIRFPPDHHSLMSDVEASVGLVQLQQYDHVVARRRAHARHYADRLGSIEGWVLPPLVEGSTYSHYVVRVGNRTAEIERFRRGGVQLGELIEYSVPHMRAYAGLAEGAWPNALLLSKQTINLPVHADLSDAERDQVVALARKPVA